MQMAESAHACPANGCGPFGTCQSCGQNDENGPMEGKHCICDVGYAGTDCSFWVDLEHYQCDCSTAMGDAGTFRAGAQCEFFAHHLLCSGFALLRVMPIVSMVGNV